MNYLWLLTIFLLQYFIFADSIQENNQTHPEGQNNTIEIEVNTIGSNLTDKGSLNNKDSNNRNTETNISDSKSTQTTNENEQINSSLSESNNTTNSQEEASVIHQIENNEIDYTNEFNLTIQMEQTYNQTEYNYQDENSQVLEEAEEVNDNKTYQEKEDEKEYREWQEKVADFNVAEMLTVKVKNQIYTFYEEISFIPSLVKVAFFNSDRDETINFSILDSKKEAIINEKDKRYGYYEFNATVIGDYKITIDGRKTRNTKKVTLAIHTGNNTDTNLAAENIDKISARIKNVKKKFKEIKMRQNFFIKNVERYFENTHKHNKHIVAMSVVECTMMVIILIVQFFYLKSLLKRF